MTTRRALILDFDGVIVATEQLHFDAWNRAFEQQLGLTVTGDHRRLVGLTLDEIYRLWSPQPLANEQKRQLLEHKTELFFELGKESLTPIDGVVDLIERAQQLGWYVTIASRARRRRLLRTLALVRLPALFDLVMGTEDVVDSGSDRKIHTRTIDPFAIPAQACIVVEDSASGVRDALACGCGLVIGYTSSLDRATLRRAGAHRVVDRLQQLRLS